MVTAPGSWCLARPCSTGQGMPPDLPSHPLHAGLWSFSFSDSVYQSSNHSLHSPEQRQPDIFCGFTLWSNLHPITSVQTARLGSLAVEWHCCDTMMVMWNSNPTGAAASIWKTSREPNWHLDGMMLIDILTVSKKQWQYLTLEKNESTNFLEPASAKIAWIAWAEGFTLVPFAQDTEKQGYSSLFSFLEAKSAFLDS